MLTRRNFMKGSMSVAGCSFCGRYAKAQSASTYSSSAGCMLEDWEAAPLMQDEDIISYATGNEPIIPQSGIPGFDRALANSLARLTAVFNVLPGFGYYDDTGSNNAYATRAKRMNNDDGTVLFGKSMLQDLLTRTEAPDAAVLAVCAHEYGHIAQYKYGLQDRLMAGQPTVRRAELNADYLAGYFAGKRKLANANFPAVIFATTQQSFGDNNVNSKGHHGTGQERGAAVQAGFEAAFTQKLDLNGAIAAGLAYVGA
ncbi:metalloprotease [Rhizobium sp. CC1099]|uniref:metalloprotease n=1 Tax=Rhizobium sp. CC1099 TaxID=3039160 RepID=UPI0024B15D73|nr:metalloprotease [Rhizobium sp. CC1099]WFU89006.1 metalloprotease [Rhizobium sp. CC1099]